MPAREVLLSTTAFIKVDSFWRGRSDVFLAQVFDIQEEAVRAKIKGVGDLTPLEQPITDWAGMLTLDVYADQFYNHPASGAINRHYQSVNDFKNYQLFFGESDVVIELYDRSIEDRLISSPDDMDSLEITESLVARVEGASWVKDGFNLTNKAVALRRTVFSYIDPIINTGFVEDRKTLLDTSGLRARSRSHIDVRLRRREDIRTRKDPALPEKLSPDGDPFGDRDAVFDPDFLGGVL